MEVNGVDKAYSLVAEGELSTILSNFNSSYTYDVVDDLMRERYNSFSLISKPNFIDELEYSFKQLLDQFPSDKDNIIYTRNKTYLEIISRISNNSGVQFTIEDTDSVDIRYLASIIFDLFISNYNEYVFKFLYNFIVNQKDFIYNQLDLIKNKKSKKLIERIFHFRFHFCRYSLCHNFYFKLRLKISIKSIFSFSNSFKSIF